MLPCFEFFGDFIFDFIVQLFSKNRLNLVPRACVPLDQRSGNSTALDESWFRFDCARVPEIVVKRTSFLTANQIQMLFRIAQRSRSLAQTRRIAASGDEIETVTC